MIVLGLNGIDNIFHDASASLVIDGDIVASVEEERFNRQKHSNGVPIEAIRYCLKRAGISFADIDQVGYYLDPEVLEKTFVDDIARDFRVSPDALRYMNDTADHIRGLKDKLAVHFEIAPTTAFHFLNHHLCHAASAFYISGFEQAAVLTIDGSGDHESASLFHGSTDGLKRVDNFLVYPQSLGFIYTCFAHHLGLGWLEGPGKLMGLAAFGQADPTLFADIIQLRDDPHRPVEVDLSFFQYHLGQGDLPAKTLQRFGPARTDDTPLTQTHFDLAATVQDAISDALMQIAMQVPKLLPDEKRLCYAGGLALNVITNRRMLDSGWFDDIFVTPPAYDGGCSLGAALHLATAADGFRRRGEFIPYLGPDIEEDSDIEDALASFAGQIDVELLNEDELPRRAAADLAASDRQRIIGWAQGRMECGPRALGNRSILTSPIPPDSKDQINARVKLREGFRPYGPSVLAEAAGDWFDLDASPYMLLEAMVREDRRGQVPGIVHVNGSSRPHTVREETNPRYYRLIKEFERLTGVPMVLNTSFNRHGEPIVNRPEEAIQVLLETDMDVVYIGRWRITKA